MGLQITERTHWFSAKDVHRPRIGLERRKQRDKEMASWNATGDYVSLMTEGFRRLREFAANGRVQACYSGPEFAVGPGDSAQVPVTWSGLPPEKDFLCDSPEQFKCTIFPGRMDCTTNGCTTTRPWIK